MIQYPTETERWAIRPQPLLCGCPWYVHVHGTPCPAWALEMKARGEEIKPPAVH